MAYFDSKQLIADTLGQLQQKNRTSYGNFPRDIPQTTIGDEQSIPVINISPAKSSFISDEFPYNIKALTLPGVEDDSEEEETSSNLKESPELQQNSISSFNWLIPLLSAGGLAALFAR